MVQIYEKCSKISNFAQILQESGEYHLSSLRELSND